jgi:nitroimidazol reductase NimA-like FMN-containing flavoprotein (pyridoxamine 5'-phosphate oxidase superfamily)
MEICMTVTFVDGFVVARSTYNTDINYRSVVIIGKATEVKDLEEKRHGLERWSSTSFPGAPRRPPANREGAPQHHAPQAPAHRILGQNAHGLAV